MICGEPGRLQFAEHVLGTRRCPIRAQADADVFGPRGGHICGLAVEPQVGERRPGDGTGCLPVCENSGVDGIGVHRNEPRLETTGGLGVSELTRDDGVALAL